jgi:hypothetical protein
MLVCLTLALMLTAGRVHAQNLAALTYPTDGLTSANFGQPITWQPVAGAQAYYLYVGTSVGAKDLINTGEIQKTSVSALNLPAGVVVYARLWTKIAGVWRYRDSSFESLIAVVTSPPNGSVIADFLQPITWQPVQNAQAYYLYVGSAPGLKDFVDSGELQQTSYSPLSRLPRGQTVYARVWTKVGGVWRFSDSSFGSFVSVLTSPADGSTSADLSQAFQWTSVQGAQAYYLYVGTTVGAKDLVNTGEMQQTSYPARNLPNGRMLYARLWTKQAGSWLYTDSTFGLLTAALTFPRNGDMMADYSQPATWNAVTDAQAYSLSIGSAPGLKDFVDSGVLQQTSYSPLSRLPRGQAVYARVWTKVGGVWRFSDSSFGSLVSVLTSPANHTQTANYAKPFQWTSVADAQAYYLYVGTTLGAKDVINTGEIQQTSLTAHLSTSQTLYARLWTKRGGVWSFSDSDFSSRAAVLTYPQDGSTTADPSHPFQWTSVPGADAYSLYVGSSVGAQNLFNSGEVQTTGVLTHGLPLSQLLYARLWTKYSGGWRYVDSSFIALPSEMTIQASNLVYQGSFRAPDRSAVSIAASGNGFDYGGVAPAFNPANNSLFLLSHEHDQQTAEIGIPALGTGPSSNLPMASVLQPFADALEGHLWDVAAGEADQNTHIGGQLVYGGQLYLNTYVYYGSSGERASYRRSLSLTTPSVVGGMAIGPLHSDFYNGYMGLVPPEWQSALGGPVLVGNCCLSIIGRTSLGPALSAVDLSALTTGSTTPAAPLVYYPSDHPTLGAWGAAGASQYFNGTTQIKGVVFPAGTSSVLFFGRQGLGVYCYGEAVVCGDPEDGSKGDHAYPYVYYVWAYDAHDLAAVHAGQKQPWDVRPYAVWSLTLPTASWAHELGGAAYDPATGRLFISQLYGDQSVYPVIHVFTIQ